LAEVHEIKHPLIQHKLTLLRMKETEPWLFRQLVNEITYLMLYEGTRNLRTTLVKISTPLEETNAPILADEIVIVPILRAGVGMLDGFLRLMPMARVGFLGFRRNEDTLEPEEYYVKLPELNSESRVIIADPMLATGGTVIAAVDVIKKHGGRKIDIISLIASPEGIKNLNRKHPDVNIYTATIDRELDERGYIRPGLGDCGDRLFWTI